MSNCNKARGIFSPHLEKEASALEERFLLSHLADCPACREELDDLKASQALLAGLPRVEVSADFEARVLEKVRLAARQPAPERSPLILEFRPRWWEGWIPRFALAGAAAALLVLASINTLHKSAGDLAGRTEPAGGASALTASPVVSRLEDRFPDLPPEVRRALDEESYVLDRMTIRPATSPGQTRVLAPVDQEASGPVYVTF